MELKDVVKTFQPTNQADRIQLAILEALTQINEKLEKLMSKEEVKVEEVKPKKVSKKDKPKE